MPTARSPPAAAPSGLGKAIALRTDLVKIRPDSDAARASHAIGATIGFSIIFALWIFGADLLDAFALATRGDKIIVEKHPVLPRLRQPMMRLPRSRRMKSLLVT